MNKTAMQALKEIYELNPHEFVPREALLNAIRVLLDTERQQIEDAFNEAQHSTMITSEDYFTTTYKTS